MGRARARGSNEGWIVEIAIPFRSLRYPAPGPQIWGVQFRRVARGENEFSYLTPMPAAFTQRAMVRVSQAATLVGPRGAEGRAESRGEALRPGRGDDRSRGQRAVHERPERAGAGIDAKYTFKNGLVADVTLNTDFAQVEEDEQQVNLTRFSLFFPERREFFLEGAGIFAFGGASVSQRGGQQGPPSNTPILFYSRQIGLFEYGDDETAAVPMLAGGRLTGGQAPTRWARSTSSSAPTPPVGAPATNFSVVRVKRDILRQSSVGRDLHEPLAAVNADGSNQTLGADAAFTFYRYLTINAYLRAHQDRGEGRRRRELSRRRPVDAETGTGSRPSASSVERNFNPEVGFLRREDFRRNFGMFRFSPRPKGPSAIRKYEFETSFDHFTDTNGRLETQLAAAQAGMDLQNGDEWRVEFKNNYEYLDEPFEIDEGLFLPVGAYRFNDVEARYTIGPQRQGERHGLGRRRRVLRRHAHGRSGTAGRVEVTAGSAVEPGIAFNWVDLRRRLVPREAPHGARHLQPVAAQGAHGAGAVQLRRRRARREPALPVGVPPGLRPVRRLQRGPRHDLWRQPLRLELPLLRREGHPAVQVLGRRCAARNSNTFGRFGTTTSVWLPPGTSM